jgi:1,2-phenylacetyl-CoA epoxidase catalytic subunit
MTREISAGTGGSATREEALADVIGALAYAIVRVFEVTAGATVTAPSMALRERQASFAVDLYERYRLLRRRLEDLTPDPAAAMERFREPLDHFYERAPRGDWLEAQVFHFVGEAITSDFAAMLTASLDDRTAAAVREALTARTEHAAFALAQVREAMAAGESVERVGAVAGKIVGEALSHLRRFILDSDALAIVLGGEDRVKDLVLELLGRHRERLEMLGVDTLD